jgi:hypothetical protein
MDSRKAEKSRVGIDGNDIISRSRGFTVGLPYYRVNPTLVRKNEGE